MSALPVLRRWLKRIALVLATALVTLLLVRAWDARQLPDLALWHHAVPVQEWRAAELDGVASWDAVLAGEQRLFAEVAQTLDTLPPELRRDALRYARGSTLDPLQQTPDWNRSYERTPATIRGGALLLHGLTDGPYSMRHLAALLEAQGYAVLVPRLPGHGTVPGALRDVAWEDWAAMVRVAARALSARLPQGAPLLVVGYSNGAALALDYALSALEDASLPRPARVVLLSPMVQVSVAARFAPWLDPLDRVPGFEKTAWFEVLPELNPYKYQSFALNAAHQSWQLTERVRATLARRADDGTLDAMPPMLAFQSVLDTTVSTDAVVYQMFDLLPANGSELVLFDINRERGLEPLVAPAAWQYSYSLLHDTPRRYRMAAIVNRNADTREVMEIARAPGSLDIVERELPLAFPPQVYSLSHVALPFPCDDPLYGTEPRGDEDVGTHLGNLALRGERRALRLGMEQLMRLTCNPFFPYLEERVRTFTATVDTP